MTLSQEMFWSCSWDIAGGRDNIMCENWGFYLNITMWSNTFWKVPLYSRVLLFSDLLSDTLQVSCLFVVFMKIRTKWTRLLWKSAYVKKIKRKFDKIIMLQSSKVLLSNCLETSIMKGALVESYSMRDQSLGALYPRLCRDKAIHT